MGIASVARTGRPVRRGPEPATSRRRSLTPYLLLLPGIAWLAALFVVPIGALFGTSLQVPTGEGLGSYRPALRFANYLDVVSAYHVHFLRAFGYAALATVLALVIAYPLAYVIAHEAGRWRNVLLVLVIAPFYTSFVLRTVAWRQLLGEEGWIVQTLRQFHLVPDGATVTASAVAVVAGLTYNYLPFMTLPLYASLERLDRSLIEAGRDLYGNALTTFRRVILPLSMPGVVAGTLLTFIPAAGDYVNAALLGRPSTAMIGNVVESRFLRVNDYPSAAALSFVLMLTILALVTVYVRRSGTEDLV